MPGRSGPGSSDSYIDPEQSGKMAVLFRLMQTMRAVQRTERIVIVSNYTSTLDLIEVLCKQNNWPVLRLDGTISVNNRTKLVDEFNNPQSNAFAFLLSSKAGGCGINLIGGNRLVLFDPDWNPASDKQAAARIWREGQKKRCFIYRFMATGSIEEKIIQRQLSKEGLVDIVDDKEQINQFSSDELRNLFTLQNGTRSDTHDTLQCKRCKFVKKREGKITTEMPENQAAGCLTFLETIENNLLQESIAFQKRELLRSSSAETSADGKDEAVTRLPFHDLIEDLRDQIKNHSFPTLSDYSRKQRALFKLIDDTFQQQRSEKDPDGNSTDTSKLIDKLLPKSFSIYSMFIKQWTDLVPELTAMKLSSQRGKGNDAETSAQEEQGEGDNDDEDTDRFVEQEGCPEETDFNRWSHHCSPLTCDDELFAKALGDDENLVSFIFGLEINFSLLEQREQEQREENERRKLQQQKDLEELNARRKSKLETRSAISDESSQDGDCSDHDIIAGSSGEKENQINGKSTGKKTPASSKRNKEGKEAVDGVTKKPKPSNKTDPAAEQTVKAKERRNRSAKLQLDDAQDYLFQQDCVSLKKLFTKGKLPTDNFLSFWKVLKNVNNNWRMFPHESGVEVYARTPGLKRDNLERFDPGVDFFLGKEELLMFILQQLALSEDDLLQVEIQALLKKEQDQAPGAAAVDHLDRVKEKGRDMSRDMDRGGMTDRPFQSSSRKPKKPEVVELISPSQGKEQRPLWSSDEDDEYMKSAFDQESKPRLVKQYEDSMLLSSQESKKILGKKLNRSSLKAVLSSPEESFEMFHIDTHATSSSSMKGHEDEHDHCYESREVPSKRTARTNIDSLLDSDIGNSGSKKRKMQQRASLPTMTSAAEGRDDPSSYFGPSSSTTSSSSSTAILPDETSQQDMEINPVKQGETELLTWTCAVCTFINNVAEYPKKCGICK